MTTVDGVTAFEALQLSLVLGTDFDSNLLLDALMEDPNSLESYSTFYRALLKAKIDPTELLTIASTLTLQTDSGYLMYVGLALRFGANPNTYVTGTFTINDVDTEVPVHLAKHLWDMVPRFIEESARDDGSDVFSLDSTDHPVLDILGMMMLSGLDPNAQVTTADLLLQDGIDATAFMADKPDFGYSLYETFDNDDEAAFAVGEQLRYFQGARGNLQLAYGLDASRDEKLLAYAFHLDLPEILTLSNVYADVDNYRKLIFFQDVKAFTVLVPTLKQLGIIGGQDKTIENLMVNWTVEYYALEIMMMLLDARVRIGDEVKNETIELAKATCEPYPVQCQLLNRMIVEYVRQGYLFNQNQLSQVAGYSPITYDAIQAQSLSPGPRILTPPSLPPLPTVTTTITRKSPNPQRRLLIGDRDLPSIGNGTIDDQAPKRSPAVSYNQSPILPSRTYSPPIPPTSSPPTFLTPAAPSCANGASLPQPIEDYNAVDRVTYSDGHVTWCFTSDIYQELLKTGMNPWAINSKNVRGRAIPEEVMTEIAEKFDALKCNRLLSGDQDILAQRDIEELYRLAEEYGVARERFYRLTSRDFQQLSDAIVSPQSRVVIDQSNPILAIRGFARAVLAEARLSRDRVGNLLARFLLV